MVIAISNWYDFRFIEIFRQAISPGTLTFPFTFLLSDIITEVYGYKHARKAIWVAFVFNVIFLLFGKLVTILPTPEFTQNTMALNKLFFISTRVIVASFLSYLISEPLNSYIVAKLKIFFKGDFMGIRFITSTIIASALDTTCFVTIAFSGVYQISQLVVLIFNIWLFKTIIEICGLPVSIRMTNFLKKKEALDIYDYNTNFNIFKLDSEYTISNNQFNQGDKTNV